MPKAKQALEIGDIVYFLGRGISEMYRSIKLVLVLLLVQQNAEVYDIPPVKHVIINTKNIYLHVFIT